ncbi:site-specific integrase [bacterium]|nr:site-specific integrase [bacterium]
MNLTQTFDWVESIRPSWQPTAKSYVHLKINQRHVIKALGDISIDELTPMSYVLIQQYALAQGKQTSTANRITAVLSCAVKELVKHKKLDAVIPFDMLREPPGRKEFYSEDEIQRLLAACKQLPKDGDVFFDLFFLASKTGARKGELLKLTWDCISFEENTLTFYDTKNFDDRTLPLTPEVRGLLKRMYRNRLGDELFEIKHWQALDTLRKCQAIAGISQKKNFHSYRHSAATNLFAKGAELPVIMQVLGHRSAATSLRYSHATEEGLKKAMATL